MKPVKPVPTITEEDVQKTFDECKQGLLMKIEAQRKQARRADVVLELYREAKAVSKNITFDIVEVVIERIESDLEAVATDIEGMTLEELVSDDYKDPIAHYIMYYSGGKLSCLNDVFVGAYAFQAIRPYGEALEQLRYQIKGNLEAINGKEE